MGDHGQRPGTYFQGHFLRQCREISQENQYATRYRILLLKCAKFDFGYTS